MEAEASGDPERAQMTDDERRAKNEKDYLDSLKKRVQMFSEAIVKMVCPVFLPICVSLVKVDLTMMQHQHNQQVRDSMSPLAALTLLSGIASLFPLSLSNSFPDKLFGFSVFFVHLCAVLLMALAFLPLLLISLKNLYWLVLLAPIAVSIVIWAYWSVRNGHEHDATVYGESGDKLENSVDFSAAITFLLFVGLGSLVLGGQYIGIQGKELEYETLLASSLELSFFLCILGVLFMLVLMAPPVRNDETKGICSIIDIFNNILGLALSAIVLFITLGTLRSLRAASFALALSVLPLIAWAFTSLFPAEWKQGEAVKPASLGLTKVTFAGFLAISIHTISYGPDKINWAPFSFIVLTAAAVNNGLGWRLFTHEKKPSEARFKAAYVASLCARVCISISVIPFVYMAYNALREITTASPAPSPNCG